MRKTAVIIALIISTFFIFASDDCNCDGGCGDKKTDPFNRGYISIINEDIGAYSKAAWKEYMDGNYENAAVNYLMYVSRNMDDASAIYNLACCYGLLGKPYLAANYLSIAYNRGFTDIEYIDYDGDFDNVRNDSFFAAITDSLKMHMKDNADIPDMYFPAETFIPSLLIVPEVNDDTKRDLYVCLHGYGSNNRKFSSLETAFGDNYMLFPSAPYPAMIRGNEIGYSWELDESTGLTDKSALNSSAYIVNAVTKIIKKHKDIGNVYIMGFSQGGHIAYVTGLNHPELFNGIIVFGTWLDQSLITESDLKKAGNTYVYICHGTEDGSVDIKKSEEAYDYLKEAKLNVKRSLFNGAHEVPLNELQEAVKWLENNNKE